MHSGGLDKYRLVYSHLWQYFGSKWQIKLSFILQIISSIVKLIVLPVATSLVIASLSRADYDGAKNSAILFVTFSLILGILTPLIQYVGLLVENKVYGHMAKQFFEKLISSDLDYFNSHQSGYLTTTTRHYTDSSIHLVRTLRSRYIGTILSIVFPLVVITYVNIKLGLVILLLNIFMALYLLYSSKILDRYRKIAREYYKITSGKIADIISNILAVKSSAQEETQLKEVHRLVSKENDAYSKRFITQSKIISLRELITVCFFAIVLWMTISQMQSGSIEITEAVLVITYLTTILKGIYALTDDLDSHDDLIDKILPGLEIINRRNSIKDPEIPLEFKNIRGDIELSEVNFCYDNQSDTPVLQDFSLNIPAGQKVGVVGLSGAGKSTLTKLILRFKDVSSGSIKIDNIDIRNIKQSDLRTNIAYVPQEPLLFHSSIRENVALSNPEATENELIKALKQAHAWDFVKELPEGIDSVVGERGVKLSGGQKQRVAIARAVLQNTPIILLDEATSALDSESEHIIKTSLKDVLKNRTAIVVAHRLSTLSDMDRIIVIDKGQLIEDGTHESLLADNRTYAKLWRKQLKQSD